MTILLHAPSPVHSKFRIFSPPPEPIRYHSEPEPFHVGPEDEAYDLGYRLARDGEAGESGLGIRAPAGTLRGVAWRFVLGRIEGLKARQVAEARELGRTLAHAFEACEPPAGLAKHEIEAFRLGLADGLAEIRDEVEYEAWVASVEEERSALALADSITDADVHPAGVC